MSERAGLTMRRALGVGRRAILAIAALPFLLVVVVWPAGCGETNREACLDYVAEANAGYRQCGYEHLVLDAGVTCPPWLDFGGADCTAYYRCLGEHSACVDGEIDFAALEACTGCR